MGATPTMNRSAQGGARSSLHYGGEGVLIHPPYQGVCGRHGTEEPHVTWRRTGRVCGRHHSKRAYKPAGERASDAGSVVGRLQRYHKRGESRVTEPIGDQKGSGKAAGVRWSGRVRKSEEQSRKGGTVS